MSSVLPESRIDQIEFCEAHWPVWDSAPPATIGLSAGQILLLKNATSEARLAYDQAQAIREAAKAATTVFYDKTSDMRSLVADYIRQIKAFAELQPSPALVFAAAQIPEPAAPTPQPAPGKAENISVGLESSGAVTLTWEATDAAASSGAFYTITRKLPGGGGFTQVGGSPGTTQQKRRMSFTDHNVPTSAAAEGVQYIIQGRRGDLMGEASGAVVVQFGVEGQGFNVSGAGAMKLAA